MVPEETLERAAVDDVSPRYLRKQKAGEGKRRRTRPAPAARSWGQRARRAALIFLAAFGVSTVIGWASYLLWFSPATRLEPAGIEIQGEHYVSSAQIAGVFSADIGKSVLLIPLDRRLRKIQAIPWIRQATIERVLPNELAVRVEERQPVAYLSTPSGMRLIDADGVILDRPSGANFNLPIVTGLGPSTPVAERARRVGLFFEFLKQIQTVRPSAASEVSQANLASSDDVQVTLAGAPEFSGQGPVIVDFGDSAFADRYRVFLADFPAWQAKAGSVEAVDLRYDGQALVTPAPKSSGSTGSAPAASAPASGTASSAAVGAPSSAASTQGKAIRVREISGRGTQQQ
jgi:cell division protein FtsQ